VSAAVEDLFPRRWPNVVSQIGLAASGLGGRAAAIEARIARLEPAALTVREDGAVKASAAAAVLVDALEATLAHLAEVEAGLDEIFGQPAADKGGRVWR
jgi:hypothetical protein